MARRGETIIMMRLCSPMAARPRRLMASPCATRSGKAEALHHGPIVSQRSAPLGPEQEGTASRQGRSRLRTGGLTSVYKLMYNYACSRSVHDIRRIVVRVLALGIR